LQHRHNMEPLILKSHKSNAGSGRKIQRMMTWINGVPMIPQEDLQHTLTSSGTKAQEDLNGMAVATEAQTQDSRSHITVS
jgi:hypothetical protein